MSSHIALPRSMMSLALAMAIGSGTLASIGATPVAAASAPTAAPDLATASDLGRSDTDDLTSDSTPTVSVAGGANGYQVVITALKGSEAQSCTYTVGSQSDCTLPTLDDGIWTLTATFADAGGTSAPGPGLDITVDTDPLVAPGQIDLERDSDTGDSNTDDITSDSTPTFSRPGHAGDLLTITAVKDGIAISCSYVVGTEPSCTMPTALADGTWTVTGTLTDEAGNVSPASTPLALIIDTSGVNPQPDLLASSDSGSSDTDNISSDKTPDFSAQANAGELVTITATNGTSTFECSYTKGSGEFCTMPELSDGVWTVSASVTDLAGNSPSAGATLTYTLRSVPPNTPSTPDLLASSDDGESSTDNETTDLTPSLTASGASPGGRVTIAVTSGTTTRTCSYLQGASRSCTMPALALGTWIATATITDPAGNVSNKSSTLIILISRPEPPAPPATITVSDLVTSAMAGSSASFAALSTVVTSSAGPIVAATACLLVGGGCTLSATVDGCSWTMDPSSAVISVSVDATAAAGTREVRFQIKDSAGNLASGTASLTVEAKPAETNGGGNAPSTPTPQPTTKPTPKPVKKPTSKTPATATPTATPSPTRSPTAQPTAKPTGTTTKRVTIKAQGTSKSKVRISIKGLKPGQGVRVTVRSKS